MKNIKIGRYDVYKQKVSSDLDNKSSKELLKEENIVIEKVILFGSYANSKILILML